MRRSVMTRPWRSVRGENVSGDDSISASDEMETGDMRYGLLYSMCYQPIGMILVLNAFSLCGHPNRFSLWLPLLRVAFTAAPPPSRCRTPTVTCCRCVVKKSRIVLIQLPFDCPLSRCGRRRQKLGSRLLTGATIAVFTAEQEMRGLNTPNCRSRIICVSHASSLDSASERCD